MVWGGGGGWMRQNEPALSVQLIRVLTHSLVLSSRCSPRMYSTPTLRRTQGSHGWKRILLMEKTMKSLIKKILQKCQFCMKNIKDLKSLKKYIDALYRELDLNCKYKEAGHKWKYFCKSIYWCMYKLYKYLL